MSGFGFGFGFSPLGALLNSPELAKAELLSNLQTSGIYDKCDVIQLYADNATPLACLKGSGIDATLIGTEQPTLESLRGCHVNVNGIGCINTNFIPSVNGSEYKKDSAHFSFFILENIPQVQAVCGVYDGSNVAYRNIGDYTAGGSQRGINDGAITTGTTSKIVKGHHCVVRESSTVVKEYINGTLLQTYTKTSGNLPSKALYMGCFNNNGTQALRGLSTYSFFTAGSKLTAEEVALLSGYITTYISKINADNLKIYDKTSLFAYRDEFNWTSQCGDYRFGFDYNTLYFSIDKGVTKISKAFNQPTGQGITFSHIFDNGDVIFATGTKIYRSTDHLSNYAEITVTDGGSAYVPHTPSSATKPGTYFKRINVHKKIYSGENEILVWGNYANVTGGASPVNIYYTIDNGATIKIAYKFGQNPYHRDDGSLTGGTTGTLLGDAGNAVFCRHVHSITYNDDLDEWYVCTGDAFRAEGSEIRWLKGVYDSNEDTWAWDVIITADSDNRYKSAGLQYMNGYIYWVADNTGMNAGEFGLWKSLIADIADTGLHTRVYNPAKLLVDLKMESNGDLLMCPDNEYNTIYVSKTFGVTTQKIVLSEMAGPMRLLKINDKDSEGYYLLAINSIDDLPGLPVVKIKIV